MRIGPRTALVVLAAAYTALNAARPLLIDDAAYEYFARQMARAPLDPYGFAILWYDQPQPANEVLAPPVLPYYWALVRSLLGERPWVWKLALFPWALLFVTALHGLFRRFGPGQELVFTAAVLFSPGLLPSFNLMLDVPALALSLTAMRAFVAAERGSLLGAAGAGLLAGVGMQTKYTAALAPGAMLLYAALTRRWGLGLLAASLAGGLFVLWEVFIARRYGQSHFLLALGDGGPLADKLANFPCLFSQIGGAFPLGALFALAGLGARQRWLVLGAAGVGLGHALIALLDVQFTTQTRLALGAGGPWVTHCDLADVVFTTLALTWAAGLGAIAWRSLADDRAGAGPKARRDSAFLLLWLGLEVLGYVALTPFPAVRRVLGLLVVGALLLARCPPPARAARALALSTAALGLATFALDWRCVAAHQIAAQEAARLTSGGGTVWYVGHWGFQFYAERAGMRPVITDAGGAAPNGPVPLPPPSRLRAGDWLVVPDGRLEQQALRLEMDKLRPAACLSITDAVPLTTIGAFYGGRTPLRHHAGSRLEVRIFRVTEDFTARAP
jgi:hypothetical protein